MPTLARAQAQATGAPLGTGWADRPITTQLRTPPTSSEHCCSGKQSRTCPRRAPIAQDSPDPLPMALHQDNARRGQVKLPTTPVVAGILPIRTLPHKKASPSAAAPA